jgi:hypothetical protein
VTRPSLSGEYDRGREAGEIAARLTEHDEHFKLINGSMGRVAEELHGLRLAVQRLGDQAVARDATVITTAEALKNADQLRRANVNDRWSPLARMAVLLTTAAAVVSTIVAIWLGTKT